MNNCASFTTQEVDYLIHVDAQIVPIEVKSGTAGRLKSLQIMLAEKHLPLGVRISHLPLQQTGQILSVPFYLIGELPRLVVAAS